MVNASRIKKYVKQLIAAQQAPPLQQGTFALKPPRVSYPGTVREMVGRVSVEGIRPISSAPAK
jgi:hypothetical protein